MKNQEVTVLLDLIEQSVNIRDVIANLEELFHRKNGVFIPFAWSTLSRPKTRHIRQPSIYWTYARGHEVTKPAKRGGRSRTVAVKEVCHIIFRIGSIGETLVDCMYATYVGMDDDSPFHVKQTLSVKPTLEQDILLVFAPLFAEPTFPVLQPIQPGSDIMQELCASRGWSVVSTSHDARRDESY